MRLGSLALDSVRLVTYHFGNAPAQEGVVYLEEEVEVGRNVGFGTRSVSRDGKLGHARHSPTTAKA